MCRKELRTGADRKEVSELRVFVIKIQIPTTAVGGSFQIPSTKERPKNSVSHQRQWVVGSDRL